MSRRFASVSVALLLAVAHASAAAPSLRESLPPEARETFDAAGRAYRQKQWSTARSKFEEVFTRTGDVRVLYNVAVCDKAEGRFARALATMRRILASKQPEDSNFTVMVSDSLNALSKEVGEVSLRGLPEGASVHVDGDALGLTDAVVTLDVGSHRLSLERPGYQTRILEIVAVRGQRLDVEASLVRLQAPVSVTAGDVHGGVVLVDGAPVGPLPWNGLLPSGQHEVVVQVDGFRPERRSFQVDKDDVTVSMTLKSLTPKAWLNVRCERPQCAIELDGIRVGVESFRGSVAAGEHRLRLLSEHTDPKFIELALRDGERRDVVVTPELRAPSGSLTWLWVSLGVVAVGATAATLYAVTRPTQFEGQAPGTLDPRYFTAHRELRP